MKLSTALSFLSLLAAGRRGGHGPLPASAQVIDNPLCETTRPYDYDSGDVTMAATVISHKGTPWIQLDLTGTKLAAGAHLVLSAEGSTVMLDAAGLKASNGFSDQFEGERVSVELVSSPKSAASRVVVSNYVVGMCDGKGQVDPNSICGPNDDRVASTDVRQGRIGGCTGWLISEDVFVQAGHCGTPSSNTRIHFTYGVSSAPTEDQYAVVPGSYQGVNGGVGNDWGAGRLQANVQTGKLPGVAQSDKCGEPGCGWYNLGTVPTTTSGNSIRITGYGTAAVASRSQKTHVGALVGIQGTSLSYVPDTTGGNSGSPVVHEETGNAIGVHTHGGCSATGGSNKGTRIDRPEFYEWVQQLLGGAPPPTQAPTPPPTPCPSGETVVVEVTTDNYPGETSWTLARNTAGTTEESPTYTEKNTLHRTVLCEASPEQYEFVITDAYGDGICCTYGQGSYKVKLNDVEVASGGSFAQSETKNFSSGDPVPPPTPPPVAPTPPPVAPTNPPFTSEPTPYYETASPSPSGTSSDTDFDTASPSPSGTSADTDYDTASPTPYYGSDVPTPYPSTGSPSKECPPDLVTVQIDVKTDAYPGDTSWVLKNLCGRATAGHAALRSRPMAADELASQVMCLPPAQYEFVIMDSNSDGLDGGYYGVTYGGEQVASGGNFGYAEKTHFGECTAESMEWCTC